MRKFLVELMMLLVKWIEQATVDTFSGFESSVKVSLAMSPFIFVADRLTHWSVTNGDYITLILGAILIDWVFGTVKHINRKTFTFKNNAIGLVTKIALATGGGFLFEALSHITADASMLVVPLKVITRVIVFMYPALSAWENIYIVSGERFPPKAWMDKLKKWNKSLDVRDLTDKENRE